MLCLHEAIKGPAELVTIVKSGEMLQWYLSVRLRITQYLYKFTSVLNNYQQRISGIIARDDNLEKSDAKKCQQLYICMLCVHEAIKGPTELVTIVKPDEILSLSDVSVGHCFVITTVAIRMMRQGSKVYHHQILQ